MVGPLMHKRQQNGDVIKSHSTCQKGAQTSYEEGVISILLSSSRIRYYNSVAPNHDRRREVQELLTSTKQYLRLPPHPLIDKMRALGGWERKEKKDAGIVEQHRVGISLVLASEEAFTIQYAQQKTFSKCTKHETFSQDTLIHQPDYPRTTKQKKKITAVKAAGS